MEKVSESCLTNRRHGETHVLSLTVLTVYSCRVMTQFFTTCSLSTSSLSWVANMAWMKVSESERIAL